MTNTNNFYASRAEAEAVRTQAQYTHPLIAHLDCAVPLLIAEIKAKSTVPTEADWNDAKRLGEALGPRGDVLLYGGSGAGELASAAARSIAVLSFCPGGITLFGRRWEATP